MINVKTNHGVTSLSVSGSLSEIVADVFMIVKKIYDSIEDDEIKELFKKCVTDRIEEPFMTMDELDDKLEINKKDEASEAVDALKDLLDCLNEILKEHDKKEE